MENNYLHRSKLNEVINEGESYKTLISSSIKLYDSLYAHFEIAKPVENSNPIVYRIEDFLSGSDNFAFFKINGTRGYDIIPSFLNGFDINSSIPNFIDSAIVYEFNQEQKELQILVEKLKSTKNIQYYFLIKKIIQQQKQRLLDSLYQIKKITKYAKKELKLYFIKIHFFFIRAFIRKHIKNLSGDLEEDNERNSLTQEFLFIINLNPKSHEIIRKRVYH